MALIDLLKQDKAALDGYTIGQIVAICGDGRLRDNNVSSVELRYFLTLQSPQKLTEHAQYCLENKFEKSGLVLQDIVNEIGRRLGYAVSNGLYQGRSNAIGFDGLWSDGENELLIEVKTSDAYRINLDTLFDYGTKIDTETGRKAKNRYSLIVVGRQDTGDLEAQVRGSRHAWSVRMVSVEALSKLMFVNAELEDQALTDKIRKVLLPFEYTRVDHIIDLVFETQQESDANLETDEIAELEDKPIVEGDKSSEKGSYSITPLAELDAKRLAVAGAFFEKRKVNVVRKSKTNFSNDNDEIRITCAISKKYEKGNQPYWYALFPAWVDFMKGSPEGFFVLGCMDRNEAFAIPIALVESVLEKLNTSIKKNGKHYWHIQLSEDNGAINWNLSKVGEKINLTPYKYDISS